MGNKNNSYVPIGDSPKQLAEKIGKTEQTVYRLAKILGRLPTIEELQNLTPGRPSKYPPTDLHLKDLIRESGYTAQTILIIAKSLGRLPSIEELREHRKTTLKGRKRKYY